MKMYVYSTLAKLVAKEKKKETQTQYKHANIKRIYRTPGCPALRTGMVLGYDHFVMVTSSMRFLLLSWLHYYSYPYIQELVVKNSWSS